MTANVVSRPTPNLGSASDVNAFGSTPVRITNDKVGKPGSVYGRKACGWTSVSSPLLPASPTTPTISNTCGRSASVTRSS